VSLIETERQNPFRLAEITRREDFGALLDRCFPVAEGRRFFDDFPVWDPERAKAPVRLGLYQGERLVACAGLRMARLHSETPVALIGAVASDAEFRGQGLASRLVSELVDRASTQGAALAMLWGSEHSMYSKLGFELSGAQVRAPLAELELPDERIQFQQGWSEGIFEALRRRGSGLLLEDSDLHWYRHHEGTFWFRVEEAGKVKAYAALGRGIDLGGIVHEWGGEPDALGKLLAAIRRCIPEAELLGPTGVADFGLNRFASEHLALVRVLDPVATRATLGRLWIWGLDAV
jgi:predicted N-acetyltransferase YhbS